MRNDRHRTPGRKRIAVAAVALAASAVGFSVAAQDDAPSVDVDVAEQPDRAELIRMWDDLLAEDGEELPNTSTMSTEEIRAAWGREYAEHADASNDDMGVDLCSGWTVLYDPRCW
ncbi:hypothetical protein [Streptomyces sp. NBC_00842]|uniref:hypothetical protein n=1 Tax=Streptomyces sp. NBC_00842 TaxID=2975848 RepID=UPI0038658995|nr:hypothetical protein OH821_13470 [Streptomyces sp. NBC_00842]